MSPSVNSPNVPFAKPIPRERNVPVRVTTALPIQPPPDVVILLPTLPISQSDPAGSFAFNIPRNPQSMSLINGSSSNLPMGTQPQPVPLNENGEIVYHNGANTTAVDALQAHQIRDAQMTLMRNISGHVSDFFSDVSKYLRDRQARTEGTGSNNENNLPANPQEGLQASWAVGRPLCLELTLQKIGDPDTRLQPPRQERLRIHENGEENPPQPQSGPMVPVGQPSETSTSQDSTGIDNPTSFYKAFPESGTRLWPCLNLDRIRNKNYLSSCTDKVLLKFMSRYLCEHALDQLARCDPNSLELKPNWVLTEHNIYWKSSRRLVRAEERQKGDMCSCTPGIEGNRSGRGGIACSDERCENRAMNIECVPGKCGGGVSCNNVRLQQQNFPKVKVKMFLGKGYGLVATGTIPAGTMIAEYLGDVVSEEMFMKRLMDYQGERHFYFMSLNSKLFIDASRRAGVARFINHSCDPNCIAEKWNAGGEPHVVIIAQREIQPREEITFSYQAQPLGRRPTKCMCGSRNCQGWLTPMPCLGMEDRETGSADSDGIAASKIDQANSDLTLAEEILQYVYDMNQVDVSRI